MKKMERLVGIIYALKENKKLTAKEISSIFEVSERTIYRDIDALCQLKVPIKALEGYGGGYEIDESYFFPSLALRKNEVLYLLICLKIGGIIRVPNMKEDYESLKYKLLNVLDDDAKEQHMKLLERVIFDISSINLSNYRQDIMIRIIESFLEYKDLIIDYYTPKNDEFIERKITPFTLVFYSGGWYIEGYCHLRKANRSFRIDRIKNIRISEDTYSPTVIDEYFKSIDKKEKPIKAIVEMDKTLYETVKDDNIFVDAEKIICDNKVKLTVYTNEINSIIKLAIQNFHEVKIIEPIECIDRLKYMCKKILEKY